MQLVSVLLIKLLDVLTWIILIQCLMSWIPDARYSKAYEILTKITEPFVGPIRDLLFRYIDIPIDFSPIIVFFLISLAKQLIISIIW